MLKNHKPVRMCIVCKNRFLKFNLFRFIVANGVVVANSCDGRGFYLCKDCIEKDEKILKKSLNRYCKNSANLKEKLLNG